MEGKILLIEDDENVIRSLTYTLEKEGYETENVVSGRLGLEIALKSHPDLIICDLILPDTNGADVVAHLREDEWGKNAKIIILTNIDEEKIKEKLINLKVDKYMVKVESTLKQVAEAVKEILSSNP